MTALAESPALDDHIAALTAWRARSRQDQRTHFADALGPSRGPGDGRTRVGLFCPCLVQGGAETWQLSVARHVDPAKVQIVGCNLIHDDAPQDPAMAAATAALMPLSVGATAARKLADSCDVLLSWAIPNIATLAGHGRHRAKVVAVMHTPPQAAWACDVYSRSEAIDHWVAVSELAMGCLPESARGKIPASIIWNSIDPARLTITRGRAEMRRAWGIPEDAPVAGYLGRLSGEKDPAAMRRLAASLPEHWRTVVVGNGAERIEQADRLHLVGADPAAGDVINAFDVLVVPSLYESFGLTLAEGLAMRKPVVSTDSGVGKMRPGTTTLIPTRADGPTIAAAVLRAYFNRRPDAAEAIIPELQPGRFGREWTDLLTSLAPPRHPIAIDPATRDAVNACAHRGGELPVSEYIREGCCAGPTRWRCAAGRGQVPGQPTLRFCLDNVATCPA